MSRDDQYAGGVAGDTDHVVSWGGTAYDGKLWNEIKTKATGSDSDKVDAIRVILESRQRLPKESLDILTILAKDSSASVRLDLAKQAIEKGRAPVGIYFELLAILKGDEDERVRKIAITAEETRFKLPVIQISELSKAFQIPILPASLASQINEAVKSFATFKLPENLSTIQVTKALNGFAKTTEEIQRAVQGAYPSFYSADELKVVEAPAKIQPRQRRGNLRRSSQKRNQGRKIGEGTRIFARRFSVTPLFLLFLTH